MQDLLDEFRGLVSALEEVGVDFAVCGGLAVAVHARPRATLDIDLLLPRDQLEGARDVARRLGYRIDAGLMIVRKDVVEMQRLSKPDPDTGDFLSLVLLLVTPALASIWQSRERVVWDHGSLPVVSRSGLVQMKRLRGSGLDLDDIRSLEGHDKAPDMSPRAVTVRLLRTSQLRRLCLALGRARREQAVETPRETRRPR